MRTLTIVVNIEDTEKAKWIWDSHMNGNEINGITSVSTIANGDMIKQLEDKISLLENEIDSLNSEIARRW